MDNIRRFNDIMEIYYEVLDSEMKISEANKARFDKKRSEEDSEWTLMDHEQQCSHQSGDDKATFEITKDWNGIDQVLLRNPHGASSKISLHGGQVISWRNYQGEELLFTSNKAIFKHPKSMRRGIQICYPQFGDCGSLDQHGFARNKIWVIDENPPPLASNESFGKSFVDLLLKSSEEDLKQWPHSFKFRLRVSLAIDDDLTLVSRVININGKPFSFSFAWHVMISMSDGSKPMNHGICK
ncbi:putative glucose-6-phosphate 1-epimerase [Brassica napus]|uniref:putative glucose-6-phosphate 1-epimerase n=1 Tax=Brassica napus TaxID=3708 RepID=UPI00207997FD|nr:putative glucose-6-phosphate 1-epimerase [Brassica napus]